ncbi:MAG: TlpA disulfide reductase family protein [Thermodesulfobacteriota bacterium]
MADETKAEGGLPKSVVIGVVVAAIVIVVVVVMSQKQKFILMTAGAEAIDFTFPDLEGKNHKLSDMRGNVVFLNVWATWCDPCREEMPSMQYMHEKYKDKPFKVVAVSIDKGSDDPVKKFAEEYGLTFLILHDRKGSIKNTYKTTGVPETFIIDQNGIVAEKIWGPRDWSSKKNLYTIENLLAKGAGAPESYGKKKAMKPY